MGNKFPSCIAVIADMVGSRSIEDKDRTQLQSVFEQFVAELNRKYEEVLLSKFVITLGDEFQGLLLDASEVPNLLWDFESKFADRKLRVGVGFGNITTPIREEALSMDGTALHHARFAIDFAKRRKRLGGIFWGFGEMEDKILNGTARELWYHRTHKTRKQVQVLDLLRQGLSRTEVGEKLGLSHQAVYEHVQSARWDIYLQGEEAFKLLISGMVVDSGLKERAMVAWA